MVGSKTTTQSETEKKVTKTVLQSEHKDVTTDSLIDAGRKKNVFSLVVIKAVSNSLKSNARIMYQGPVLLADIVIGRSVCWKTCLLR